ncbi:hypothetical protein [Dongia deserti]|uniref:hypothetical protein n=1 Tax=Dongia deserti TaxID=2268030 RepID=UPI0013C53228|nr:hypothetical protein [Dongia deserti]
MLLGLTVPETVRFLREHHDRVARIKRGKEVWFTEEHVQELKVLAQTWLESRNTKPGLPPPPPGTIRGICNVARALGLKPYITEQFLRDLDVETKDGVTKGQIDDLKSVVDLWLAERRRDQQRTLVAERELRQLGRGLIKAVGERNRNALNDNDAKALLAEERRQLVEQRKLRRCLRCGKTFLSWHVGNRLCTGCGGVGDAGME